MSSWGAVTIRPASAADAAGIAEVHVRAWQAAYAGLLPGDYLRGMSVNDRLAMWERSLSSSRLSWSTLVVDVDATIGGFAAVGPCRDEDAEHLGELGAIYLAPRLWGHGIGRLLHDEAMALLSGEGYQTATLWVLPTNVRARRFYERAGWSLDGETRTDEIWGISVDEIRYTRSLGPPR